MRKHKDEHFSAASGGVAIGSLFVLVWIFLGLAALITSIICITKTSAAPADNIIGLLLALFLGPFYWIYFIAKANYCMEMK